MGRAWPAGPGAARIPPDRCIHGAASTERMSAGQDTVAGCGAYLHDDADLLVIPRQSALCDQGAVRFQQVRRCWNRGLGGRSGSHICRIGICGKSWTSRSGVWGSQGRRTGAGTVRRPQARCCCDPPSVPVYPSTRIVAQSEDVPPCRRAQHRCSCALQHVEMDICEREQMQRTHS